MNFSQLAEKRYSCRKFKETKVEQEKIDIILQSAAAAPTAVNRQPQKIFVLTDKEKLLRLKECTKSDFDAPLCFIICADASKAWTRKYDGENSAQVDASIVTTHMMLQAQDIGLGTTWVMSFDPQKAREIYDIEDNLDIIALLPTGYPADDAEISPMHFKSKSIDEMVEYL